VAADRFAAQGKRVPQRVTDCVLDSVSRLTEGDNAIKNLCLWKQNAFFGISF
jgi:hypothetical protein